MLKRQWLILFSVVLSGVLPGTLQAQTCNDNINATTPLHRFTINGDGTATDTRTGLRWMRCPVGYQLDNKGTAQLSDDVCELQDTAQFNWQEALQAADDLNLSGGFAGFSDWRVPNIKVLASIVEYKCFGPALNLAVFPDVLAERYWSSTPSNFIGRAEVMNYGFGTNTFSFTDVAGTENFKQYVRLVRDN